MRFANSLIALLSITAFGVVQACSSDDDGDGAGGSGAGGGPSAGGTGGNPAASGAGGARAGAGASMAGASMAGGGATAGKGGGGNAGAPAGNGGAANAGSSAAGTGPVTAGAPSGGAASGASGGPSASGAAGANGGVAGVGGATGGAAGSVGTAGAGGGTGGGAHAMMNFFVTSDTAKTGNLGGLAKADERCQSLAKAVGHGDKTWKAYLSVENPMTNARDRIGPGPYYNSKGALLAADKDALHMQTGDADLFIDEKGNKIDGQWNSAMGNNQHDILTGTKADGSLDAGRTCSDWTATTGESTVGHSDGMGPGMNTEGKYSWWSGSHQGSCSDTQPGGGAGKIYCFVGP